MNECTQVKSGKIGIDKDMRIAVIHPSLFSRGGSQRYAIQTAVELKQRGGCSVDLYAYLYSKQHCYPELLNEIDVISVKETRATITAAQKIRNSKFGKIITWLNAMIGIEFMTLFVAWFYRGYRLYRLMSSRYAKGFKYDVLFVNETGSAVIAGWLLKKKFGSKVFIYCYDSSDKFFEWKKVDENITVFARKVLELFFLSEKKIFRKAADGVGVLDTIMQKRTKDFYGINFEPVIIRGGIDQNEFKKNHEDYLRKKLHIPDNKIIVCTVSRFVPYRRIHDIIECYKGLPKEIKPGVILYLNCPITEMDYYKKCMSLISDADRENIIVDTDFPANDKQLIGIYSSSDIFVFPNEKQTWGNAVLEAMAVGTACVVSDSCGISEIIDKYGIVYPCGQVSELSKAICSLVRDKDLRDHLAATSAQYISNNFSWDKWVDNLLEQFNLILKN